MTDAEYSDVEYGDIEYAELAGVASITISRPQRHNAFRKQTITELIAAFDRADAAPGVRVVVITGAGSAAFSTGGDVAMEDAFDPAEGRLMARLLIRLAEAVREAEDERDLGPHHHELHPLAAGQLHQARNVVNLDREA